MGTYLNGVRFHVPLETVLDRLVAVRPVVEAMQKSLHASFVATRACDLLDSYHVLGGERLLPDRPLREASQELEERWKAMQRDKRRDPAIDTDASIVLFPQGPTVLGLVQTEMEPFVTLMRDLAGEDWSWGTYERPKGVEEAAWEERERTWTAAMAPAWIPSRTGLSYSYNQPYPTMVSPEDALAHLPDAQRRARSVAREAALDEAKGEMVGLDGGSMMVKISSILGNRERVDALTARFLPLLPTITVAMLRGD